MNSSGLSTTGTYKFTSATDRRKKTAERLYVSPKTGKLTKHVDPPNRQKKTRRTAGRTSGPLKQAATSLKK